MVLVAPDITELVRFDNLMLFAETVVGETEYTLDSAVAGHVQANGIRGVECGGTRAP